MIKVADATSTLGPEWPRPYIFYAGPTPRFQVTPSWRPGAIELANEIHPDFGGTLVVPECDNFVEEDWDWDAQIDWEWSWLDVADVIMFWIPRDMETLPGLTTNVEFGLYISSGACVCGAPPEAVATKYCRRLADRYGAPWYDNLPDTVTQALRQAA